MLHHFVLDRCLQQLPGSFTQQLFQVNLGFIFGSLSSEITLFSFTGAAFLLAPRVSTPFFFLVTERMRLLYPVIHNFRL